MMIQDLLWPLFVKCYSFPTQLIIVIAAEFVFKNDLFGHFNE